MSFVRRSMSLDGEAVRLAELPVVKGADLRIVREAAELMEAARAASRDERHALLSQGACEIAALRRSAETEHAEATARLVHEWADLRSAMIAQVSTWAGRAAGGAFSRLCGEVPPAERVEAALRPVIDELGAATGVVIEVPSEHLEAIASRLGAVWTIRGDPGLASGRARVVVGASEYRCSFDVAVQAFVDALLPGSQRTGVD
jgi:hypothetical protein